MDALPGIMKQSLNVEKQDDEQANYAHKLQKSEALIDWTKPARELQLQVQAFNAWPVAQTPIEIKGKSQMFRIWRAIALEEKTAEQPGKVVRCDKQGIDVATGDGLLRLLEIQMPGKKPMEVKAFVNANNIEGVLLGSI